MPAQTHSFKPQLLTKECKAGWGTGTHESVHTLHDQRNQSKKKR